jgi:predicted NAD/FAD-dependent oxidoreductase
MDFVHDVLVVGAGIAGLACAQSLAQAGKSVLVLERSAVLGGRCAAKPTAATGSILDFGPVFLHGDDEDFLAWITSLSISRLEGWPQRIRGRGLPCQPSAFEPGQFRYALREGMGALAEALGRGLEISRQTQIKTLLFGPSSAEVQAQDGRIFRGITVVLALANEQSLELLKTAGRSTASAQALLGQFSSLPSLTLLARWDSEAPELDWDVWYPEDSKALLLLSNESAKRGDGTGLNLVFQTRPAWSAARLEGDRAAWSQEILAEAARLLGPWALRPSRFIAHRWLYGRLNPGEHLTQPALFSVPGSEARLGLAGDLFDPSGGLQGAWRSGRRLAKRLIAET